MTTEKKQLQEEFLSELIESKTLVAVYLMSGIKLLGRITSYDAYVIVLNHTSTQLVHKHAIATIVPADEAHH